MSYEGYTQFLCPEGHYYKRSSGVGYGGFETKEERIAAFQCPRCQKMPRFSNEVDETNGYDPENPHTFERPLMEIARYDVPQRDHRDNFFMTLDIRYAPVNLADWHDINNPKDEKDDDHV